MGWPDGGMLVSLRKLEVVVGRPVPVLLVIWERPDVKCKKTELREIPMIGRIGIRISDD